jgi:hypothetical protein
MKSSKISKVKTGSFHPDIASGGRCFLSGVHGSRSKETGHLRNKKSLEQGSSP